MTRLSENAILPWSQLAELEVSLQALKEENMMLRDAVAEERAAVVAYLHAEAERIRRGESEPANRESALLDAARVFGRGEHRREEER